MNCFTEIEKKIIHDLWKKVLVKFGPIPEIFARQMWQGVEYQIDVALETDDKPYLAVKEYLDNVLRYQTLNFK